MLLSIINTKLRDFYSNLDDLCEDLEYDINEVKDILNTINYVYDTNLNKFVEK
jgi:hypothetical protein